MHPTHQGFRLTALLTSVSLMYAPAWPLFAPSSLAQAPPPMAGQPQLPALGPSSAEDQPALPDPPDRVGRLARIRGVVSYHTPDDTNWTRASANYPVVGGTSYWTEPGAEAELELGGARINIAGGTDLTINILDANGFQATTGQGKIYVRVREPIAGDSQTDGAVIATPRGAVTLDGPGHYLIVAGDTSAPTQVTVIGGSARITGPGLDLLIGTNQTGTITGTDAFQGAAGPAQRDPLLTARMEAERPRPVLTTAPPRQIAALPGGEDLYTQGTWEQVPDQGQVWYPPVSQGWAPYRDGHWAYVQPWGWTWIDDAPWGFAPFHYGRWAQFGPRWGWVPGPIFVGPRPVYAPALVAFVGLGAGVAVGAALASRSVSWFPLGPREPYHPWYRASNRYVQAVNAGHVTVINRNVTINNFANRGAVTSVPASTLTGSRPVRPALQTVPAAALASARPVIGQQPVRPTLATAGVTPAVASQVGIRPPPGGFMPRAAPGPAIRTAGAAGAPPAVGTPAGPGLRSGPPVSSMQGAPALTATPGVRPPAGFTPNAGAPALIATPGVRPPAGFPPNAGAPGFTGSVPGGPVPGGPVPGGRVPAGGGPGTGLAPSAGTGGAVPPLRAPFDSGGTRSLRPPPVSSPAGAGTAGPAFPGTPGLSGPASGAGPALTTPGRQGIPGIQGQGPSTPPPARTGIPPAQPLAPQTGALGAAPRGFQAPATPGVQAPAAQGFQTPRTPGFQAPPPHAQFTPPIAPRVQAPPPQSPVSAPSAPRFQAPPPQSPVPAPSAPRIQTPPPQMQTAPPPQPQFRPAPPPPPQAAAAARAAAPPPPQQKEKRPGER